MHSRPLPPGKLNAITRIRNIYICLQKSRIRIGIGDTPDIAQSTIPRRKNRITRPLSASKRL